MVKSQFLTTYSHGVATAAFCKHTYVFNPTILISAILEYHLSVDDYSKRSSENHLGEFQDETMSLSLFVA